MCPQNVSIDCVNDVSSTAFSSSHLSPQHPSFLTSPQLSMSPVEITNCHSADIITSTNDNLCASNEAQPDNKSPAPAVEAVPAMTAIPNDDDCTINLNRQNMVLAHLPNREKVITLFDSGASDSLVFATFVAKS